MTDMSIEDIQRKYRDGVPINVLAELNGCDIIEIKDVLDLGDMLQMDEETKPVDKEAAIKLLDAGKTVKEAAAELGCSEPRIYQIKREFKELPEAKPSPISKPPASRPYQKPVQELVFPEPVSKQKLTPEPEPESEAVWQQRRTEQLKIWFESCMRFGRPINIELIEEYNRQCERLNHQKEIPTHETDY